MITGFPEIRKIFSFRGDDRRGVFSQFITKGFFGTLNVPAQQPDQLSLCNVP